MDITQALRLGIFWLILGALIGAAVYDLAAGPRRRGGKDHARPAPKGQVEVFRLLRDLAAKNLSLEIGSRVIASPLELSPVEQERLAGVLEELNRWLGRPAAAAGAEPAPARGPEAVSPPGPGPAPAGLNPAPASGAFADSLPEPASMSDFLLKRKKIAPKVEPAAAPLSIIQQIDAILQEQIAGTPLFGKLQLGEAADQSMRVFVDKTIYASLDEVPDPEIRAAIKAAAQEWNRRAARRG